MVNWKQRRQNSVGMSDLISALIAKPDTHAADLNDEYSFARLHPTSGNWYYAIDCPQCQKCIPLFEDPSAGKLPNPFKGNGKFLTSCARCKEEVSDYVVNVKIIKWPQY